MALVTFSPERRCDVCGKDKTDSIVYQFAAPSALVANKGRPYTPTGNSPIDICKDCVVSKSKEAMEAIMSLVPDPLPEEPTDEDELV